MKGKHKYSSILVAFLAVIVIVILLIYVRKPGKEIKPRPAAKPRIAIVLDDWGYNLNNLHIIEEIRYPLTLAVLPNLSYSKRVSQELYQRGFEIILHLPMEPKEKYRLEKNTILTSMSEAEIINIIAKDLANIRYAKGVSNHMGSMSTSDTKTMKIVFAEFKKRHLYFLDSFVTARSSCPLLAYRMGLSFAKRDVFLDNSDNPGYIKQQVYKLKAKAKSRGFAIGIGHDRKSTLQVLKKVIPELEKEGYKFVFVSDLIK
ncbi:MAG: hypothetical protein COT38_02040 [Candidatus Omnitrophica bacterium CG08_land_8_20_14_0_20_41_16]|uniref:Divergent polysaccharide deacetylase family protein n=1 Tax=Candidatus Sherwoodlollariibacterium unditelluris TaxID=1974757 RepID=A0A2G9YKN0_9BACT|nr:MAG: hypothetical protein COX41_00960 [Candidatus Omnitrophica bacterium CG23_combo_of_CG06-09_8_20_14_all_41_10]PIS34069.1 MAG: hypothetical protein COT38_02040 [Candidatus Omnitrophica bacterium CG08_land_8_20_14_0_20_41_16]